MATKGSKSTRSAKKRSARTANVASTTRRASKKAASKKPTTKRAAKKRARVQRFTSRTLDALSRDEMFARVAAVAASCPECVIQQIQEWGGGTVTSGSQTLQQLSVNAPCSDGRLADLRQRLRTCSTRTIPLSCSATVGFIVERACPFA